MKLLKQLISEITRYKQVTGKSSWSRDDIKKYVNVRVGDYYGIVEYAFTMTGVNKVGVNPKSTFKTPLGVYFYPLTSTIYGQLVDDQLPFASEKENIGLVKLLGITTDRWLRVSDKTQTFDVLSYQKKAYDFFDENNRKINGNKEYLPFESTDDDPPEERRSGFEMALVEWKHWGRRESFYCDASKIFSFCAFLIKEFDIISIRSSSGAPTDFQKGTAGRRFNQVLRHLGFIGIYDYGFGIIHPSEEYQLVALVPSAYEVVGSYSTAELRKQDDPSLDYVTDDHLALLYDLYTFRNSTLSEMLNGTKNELKAYRYHLIKSIESFNTLMYMANAQFIGLMIFIVIINKKQTYENFLRNYEAWCENNDFIRLYNSFKKNKNVFPDADLNLKMKNLVDKMIEKILSVDIKQLPLDTQDFITDFVLK
jgi:hypothetical protein